MMVVVVVQQVGASCLSVVSSGNERMVLANDSRSSGGFLVAAHREIGTCISRKVSRCSMFGVGKAVADEAKHCPDVKFPFPGLTFALEPGVLGGKGFLFDTPESGMRGRRGIGVLKGGAELREVYRVEVPRVVRG